MRGTLKHQSGVLLLNPLGQEIGGLGVMMEKERGDDDQ